MDKIYLVKYYGGSYDNYYTTIIFATTNKSKATKYVTKFNRILKKWKEYYSHFEDDRLGFKCIKKEFVTQSVYDRWHNLRNITKCYYEEVPMR